MKAYQQMVALLAVIASGAYALHSHREVERAAQIRVAACQMVDDPQLWKDFECHRAFAEAERRWWETH